MNNSDYKNRITLCGMSTHDKWFDNTLKALLHSKRVSGIKNAQMLSAKAFFHPEVKCIKINPFNNIDEYNFFMMREYGDYIDTEFALNIHDDGFILNPDSWSDKFMEFDYIGALWTIVSPDTIYGVNETNRVGNGGFSLRSKRFFSIVKNYCPFIAGMSEDVISCRIYRDLLISHGIKFATNDIAAKFAVEDDQSKEYIGQSHQDYKTITAYGFHRKGSDAIKLLDLVNI